MLVSCHRRRSNVTTLNLIPQRVFQTISNEVNESFFSSQTQTVGSQLCVKLPFNKTKNNNNKKLSHSLSRPDHFFCPIGDTKSFSHHTLIQEKFPNASQDESRPTSGTLVSGCVFFFCSARRTARCEGEGSGCSPPACPAKHLRYLWRWINHYIIAKVHKVPGSWSNTASALHSGLQGIDALIDRRMEVERKKGLRLSNAVNTAGRWSNVCSKSQIVSAKLKEEEEEEERKKPRPKKKKKIHLLRGPSPLKLTGLQICGGMSSLRL